MAANSTLKTSEDDDKHQPVILSAPLKLQYFIQIHKNLPLCSSVAKSLFGIGKNDVLSCGQLVYLYCLKETTVLNIVDSSKRHLALPINTSVVFTPLYSVKQSSSLVAVEPLQNENFDSLTAVSFSSPKKLLDAQPRPKVVAVEKCGSSSKFTTGEILVFLEFSENSFLCYSLSQKVQKRVFSTSEADSQIGFTTEVSMVQMGIKDVADYVSLPIKGLLNFEDTRLQQSFSNICEIKSVGIKKSVLASFQPPAVTGNILKHLVEIYTSAPISLQIVEVVNEEDNRLMLQHSRKILSDFSPFCIDDVVIDVAAACSALQERLYHSSLTTQEHWRNGVKVFIPPIMERKASSVNTNDSQLTEENAEIRSDVETVTPEIPPKQHIYDSVHSDETGPIIPKDTVQKNSKPFVDEQALPMLDTAASQQQPHLFRNPSYTLMDSAENVNAQVESDSTSIYENTGEEVNKPFTEVQVLQTTSPATKNSLDNAQNECHGQARKKLKCENQSSMEDTLIKKKNSIENVSQNMVATPETQQAQPKKKSRPSVSKKPKISETSKSFLPQLDQTCSKDSSAAIDGVGSSQHVLTKRIEELAQEIEHLKATVTILGQKVENKYNAGAVYEVMDESTFNQMNKKQQEYMYSGDGKGSSDVISDTSGTNKDAHDNAAGSLVSLPADISLLTVKEVQTLLEDNQLGQYKRKFAEELIDGCMLIQLDDGLLKNELNIEVKLHRLRLLQIISTAKKS